MAESRDKILPLLKEWQSLQLNPIYPSPLWTASITREDRRILGRVVYMVLGVTTGGYKDILSITTVGAKF